MKKVTTMILMLCLVFSGVLSYASDVARIRNEKGKEGTPIEIIASAIHSSSEKGNSIIATISGHDLTVVFTENLGTVAIEITTATGAHVDSYWIPTPNGTQTGLALAGDYVITFTLSNGDEYYGEFTVTD